MPWTLRVTDTAEKQLSKLDKSVARNVLGYLSECCNLGDPAERGHGLTGPWAGFHRYRVGQLRVIVEIQRGELILLVVTVEKRDAIYKH